MARRLNLIVYSTEVQASYSFFTRDVSNACNRDVCKVVECGFRFMCWEHKQQKAWTILMSSRINQGDGGPSEFGSCFHRMAVT